MGKLKYVNDNVHGLIRITAIESMVMSQEIFNRLHNVYQNSIAYLTWPSNRVQRFEHSIGTMKLAGDMLLHSIENADDDILDSFLETAGEQIGEILNNTDDSTADRFLPTGMNELLFEIKKEWRKNRKLPVYGEEGPLPVYDASLVPSNVAPEKKAICYMLMEAVRLTGMLHDIGHPPFSHVVEEALIELKSCVEDLDENIRAGGKIKVFLDAMNNAEGESVEDEHERPKLHEAMGNRLINLLFNKVAGEVSDIRTDENRPRLIGIEVYLLGEMVKRIVNDRGFFKTLHRIVDSTVDADRLDFVRRDSMGSGLGNGAVQYSQIVESMKLIRLEADTFTFAFSIKSATPIAAFIRQRYQNYDTIVHHHHVEKTEVLLRQVVLSLGKRYLLDSASQDVALAEEVDIDEIRSGCSAVEKTGKLPDDISGLWAPFAKRADYGSVFDTRVFGQWNDAWLISVLTGEYISLAMEKSAAGGKLHDEKTALFEQLEVLLYGRKGYSSIIKRYEHVLAIDNAFAERADKNRGELLNLRNKLETKKTLDDRSILDATATQHQFLSLLPEEKKLLSGDAACAKSGEQSHRVSDIFPGPSYRFASNFAAFCSFDGGGEASSMCDLVRMLIEQYSLDKELTVKEVFVVPRSLDASVKESTYLYDPGFPEKDSQPILFGDYSNIRKSIAVEEEMRPQFYAYVQFGEDSHLSNFDEIRSEILRYIGQGLFDWFVDRLKAFVGKS